MMTIREIASKFEGVRWNPDGSFQCRCPNIAMHKHGDKKQSLGVSQGRDGKIVLNCLAGCDPESVLSAAGLSWQDVMPGRPKLKWRDRFEYGIKKQMVKAGYKESTCRYVDEYKYTDENGRYLFTKIRFEGEKANTGERGKEIRYITVNEVTDSYEYRKGAKGACLYNLQRFLQTVREGFPVFYVEGEKDVETLRKMGYTATTAGGAADWKKELAKYFTGARLVILPDNDDPGKKLADRVKRDVRNYAYTIKVVMTSSDPGGDVTDFLNAGHTKEDFQQLTKKAAADLAPWLYLKDDGGGTFTDKDVKTNADKLAYYIKQGMEYLIIRRPDDDRDDFYIYQSGVYCRMNKNAIKAVIKKYFPPGTASDVMLNNTYNLLLANDERMCSYTEMDAIERYINVRNGLYDIQEQKLIPHDPAIKCRMQLDVEYRPDAVEMPNFQKYMDDFCSCEGVVDESKKAVLQEFFGLVLSNVHVHRAKKCLVLVSTLGNTGKSLYLNILSGFLGFENIANIPLQNMNEQSRFSLGSLVGKRLISIGDQTSSEIKDSAVFKQLTGGDPVKIEAKFRQEFYYTFPGAIVIACNNLPSIADDKGSHLFERMLIVPLDNTIPREKRDPALLDKILPEKSAIFNWSLEGLQRLIANNYKFTRCDASEKASSEYRDQMDTVHRFLTEYYELTGNEKDTVQKTVFDTAYLRWCEVNEYKAVNKGNIKTRMVANGCRCNLGDVDGRRGITVYRGLKAKFTEPDEKVPFDDGKT